MFSCIGHSDFSTHGADGVVLIPVIDKQHLIDLHAVLLAKAQRVPTTYDCDPPDAQNPRGFALFLAIEAAARIGSFHRAEPLIFLFYLPWRERGVEQHAVKLLIWK